ncbi:MAG: hypothetical protein GY774_19980, partial [Planctomycetes bacterium]|nr:hypothetical protein [Planctomycetota bacterium]
EIAAELKAGFAQVEQFEQQQEDIEARIDQATKDRDANQMELATLGGQQKITLHFFW